MPRHELDTLTIEPPLRSQRAASRLTISTARVLIRQSASTSPKSTSANWVGTARALTVHDGIDRVERRVRLAEEAFDVQLIGNVRAYRHRGAVGRQELLDERLGTRLIVQVLTTTA